MKILFIAMSDSVHTARWINQFVDQGWEISLFPVVENGKIHENIKYIKIHDSWFVKIIALLRKVTPFMHRKYMEFLLRTLIKLINKSFPSNRVSRLTRIINKINPDIIHTMETQQAGYLMLEVNKHIKNKSYKWIHSNWGSDIYLFGRLPKHALKITDIMNEIDYYSCECKRDIGLAKKFSFKGTSFHFATNTGGFDLVKIKTMRDKSKTSNRKTIMLKGYQTWAGRALFGLRALERCVDALKGYTIVSYSTIPDVDLALELFSLKYKVPIIILPHGTSHNEMLEYHSQARISIGLSISDAVSTSFLEAIVMGSFPIQSYTSCADEWVIHGKTGFLVPPEDPDVIEKCIRKALKSDKLVDEAFTVNWQSVKKRLDFRILQKKAVQMYNEILVGNV